MDKTVVFIHGMFQNPRSWEKWIAFFEQKGYVCIAPAWPLHEGEPSELRKNIPEGLGKLSLQTVIDDITSVVSDLTAKPLLIGHSVGGLIVQNLLNKGLAEGGIAISSVAPNAMLSFDMDMFKNAIQIANPLKGDEPFIMTEETFHGAFANTLSDEDCKIAYEQFATHDSRNVFRDCLKEAGKVDLDKPHVPLLFIAGDQDNIIPETLVKKNSEKYSDNESITEFKSFPGRSHFICGEPGWEEVAEFAVDWADKYVHRYEATHRVDW